MVYRSIYGYSFFLNFIIEANEFFCLWNTERILISETPTLVSDKSNREFGKLQMLVWDKKVTLHPNKAPTFLLIYAITNEKTVKLMQVDRLLSASKTSSIRNAFQ